MPVIVIGADTPSGEAVVAALLARGGEVRAFVSSQPAARALKKRGVKVATGDLSDGSHVGAASFNAFSAVLVEAATADGRAHEFAQDPIGVLAVWATALQDAGVRRAIWVGSPPEALVATSAPEVTVVSPAKRTNDEVARLVADLNDLEDLRPET